jgi:hypothetical protein
MGHFYVYKPYDYYVKGPPSSTHSLNAGDVYEYNNKVILILSARLLQLQVPYIEIKIFDGKSVVGPLVTQPENFWIV